MANERKSVLKTLLAPAIVPLLIVLIMWIVFLVEFESGLSFSKYGLKPRTLSGLLGIFTIPFLHGSWSHLVNNSVPMLILGWALFKFYPTLAVKTLLWIYLMGGMWLWISGRSSYHIGASGVVYGLATFLFFSGVWRREKSVAALSLLVAFMYGSMWWGVLPVDPTISWEGHLWGGLAGIVLAFIYRKKGPQKKVYKWEEEEHIDLSQFSLEDIIYQEISEHKKVEVTNLKSQIDPSTNQMQVNYTFKPQAPKNIPDDSKG